MKCFTKPCQEEGTILDPESPAIFINPEDPTDPKKYQPRHCPEHHAQMMARRDDNEASWRRAVGR